MFRKIAAVPLLAALPCHAAPETLRCTLQDGAHDLAMVFTLDRASFAPPLSPDDPPRRQVATVLLREQRLQADALLMQTGEIGFVLPEAHIMLLVSTDGTARMSEGDRLWQGHCRAAQ